MSSAPDAPRIVEACLVPGRAERLEAALAALELCEKALQARGRSQPASQPASSYQPASLPAAALVLCRHVYTGPALHRSVLAPWLHSFLDMPDPTMPPHTHTRLQTLTPDAKLVPHPPTHTHRTT